MYSSTPNGTGSFNIAEEEEEVKSKLIFDKKGER